MSGGGGFIVSGLVCLCGYGDDDGGDDWEVHVTHTPQTTPNPPPPKNAKNTPINY